MNVEAAQGARDHIIHYVTLWLDNTYQPCKWRERMVERVKDTEPQEEWAEIIGEKIRDMIIDTIDQGVMDASHDGWVTGLLKDLLDAGDSTQWRQLGQRYVED